MSDLLLIQNSLRDAVRPKRLLIAAVLILLPGILGLLWRVFSPPDQFNADAVYDRIAVFVVMGLALPILAAVYGTGVVSQEMEGRTIVYLLTRPLPRWRILLAKALVCFFVVFVISALSLFLLALAVYGPAHLRESGVSKDILAALMGTLAYGSLFVALGAGVPRPLIFGLLFVFGWETWVPLLPGQFVRTSVQTYLRVLSARELTSDNAGDAGNLLTALTPPTQVEIPVREAWIILWCVTAFALAAALLIFSVREYAPREDTE